MRLEAGSGEVKSDLTDQDGLARKVSRSSEGGLVVEESVRFIDALAFGNRWNLRLKTILSHCFCIIAQVSLRDDVVAMCIDCKRSSTLIELKIHRAEMCI